jgi:hypothetical protein
MKAGSGYFKNLKDSTIILWHVLSLLLFCFVLESCGHVPKLILGIGTLRINKKQVMSI